jgi:hypothetical protein
MPLQIEVGKRYRTRSGDVVEAFTQDKRSGEWKVVKSNGDSYWVRENGRLFPVGESGYDLIEELPADVATP